MAKGIKHDGEKPDYSLVPFGALDEVVKALTYGANKYDRFNWKNVEDVRYQAAALRHISSYMQGEKHDPETGLNHLAHAICSLMFLVEFDNMSKKSVYNTEETVYNGPTSWENIGVPEWDASDYKVSEYEIKF